MLCRSQSPNIHFDFIAVLYPTTAQPPRSASIGYAFPTENLKPPKCTRPRCRCWLSSTQPHDGRKLRLMTLIDEFTRECLAIRVARRINSWLETMADVMLMRGVPSTSGPTTALR